MTQPDPRQLAQQIADVCGGAPRMQLMEVCGTHTVSLFRSGIRAMLPENLRLISGPGCPVCVTSQGYIDAACELAGRPEVTICTYGDMVRVPGQAGSLEHRRAQGGRVQVVYSARDAVKYAQNHPAEQVVFLAVGFETTAPATAAAVLQAQQFGLDNFTILEGHKLALPAMKALLASGDVPIDGFICPGHVSVVIGTAGYEPLAREHGKPCVVTGFEPAQMLAGILALVQQVRSGEAKVENVYGVAVRPAGNAAAKACMDLVFEPADVVWRAMGVLPASGLTLREEYREFDALARFGVAFGEDVEPAGCRCGEVIQGKVEPADCPLFGDACTPTQPIGPCMVSSEGTCAAWYKYNRPARSRPTLTTFGGEA